MCYPQFPVEKAPMLQLKDSNNGNLNILKEALTKHLEQTLEIEFPPCKLPYAENKFYEESVAVTLEQALQLATRTIEQHSNDLWNLERRKRITGSKCYELFTYCKNSSPNWQKKIENIINSPFKGNANTKYGNLYEDEALLVYEEKMGSKIYKSGVIINPSVPWVAGSPDGLIINDNCVIDTLIEVKCPIKGATQSVTQLIENSEIPYVRRYGDKLSLKKNHKYYGQIQLYLGLLNINCCHFVIYSPYEKNFILLVEYFDKQFFQELMIALHFVYFVFYITIVNKM